MVSFFFVVCARTTNARTPMFGRSMPNVPWNRLGYEFITVKSKWNVQVPFLQTNKRKDQHVESPLFSSPKNPNSKCQLKVFDCGKEISICPIHYNSAGACHQIRMSTRRCKLHFQLQDFYPCEKGNCSTTWQSFRRLI